MDLRSVEIVQRYLAGGATLEATAQALDELPDFGFGFAPDHLAPGDLERIEALMGHVLWLKLRAVDPDAVPAQPFGAAAMRAQIMEMSDEDGTEE